MKNLTAGQLIEGINLSIKNAESLFKIASKSKLSGNLGLSKSLYILCCEEAVKAFAIYNAFLIDDDRDITGVFKIHKEKLTILKEGYHLMSSMTKSMSKSFKQAKSENPNATNKELEVRATELHRKYFEEIYVRVDTEEVQHDREWWDNANLNKQRGFYIGFENGNWITPQNTNIEEVKEAEEKALLILGHILGYKDIPESKYKSEKG